MSSKIVYLVSGANRGIGLELVSRLSALPDTVVYAGTRDLSKSPLLDALVVKHSNLRPIKLTSSDAEDNKAAVEKIEKEEGQLDVVIANAGIAKFLGPVTITPTQEYRDHWETNTLGPITLFQAVAPLLLQSPTKKPQFSVISTSISSITDYMPFYSTAYGSSKAAVNFMVKAIHSEHEKDGLVALALHPGWINTEMGNSFAGPSGMKEAPETVEDSVEGLLKIILGATREERGGRFWNFRARAGENVWELPNEELRW